MGSVTSGGRLAKGRRAQSRMNGTEREYAALFLGKKPHLYAAVTLRLGDDCRYTPDFMVIAEDDVVEFHEVKGGFWRDDAKAKIAIAAEQYPWFRFKSFAKQSKKLGGQWAMRSYGSLDQEMA